RCEVVWPAAAGTPLPIELNEHRLEAVEGRFVAVVARHVTEPSGEGRPHRSRLVAATPQLLDRGAHAFAEVVVGELGARHAHDREAGRQQPTQRQSLDRRHELAAREVARRAEHDEHGRRRHLVADRLRQRVGVAHVVPASRSAFWRNVSMSSSYDLAKDATPSSSSTRPTSPMSMPTAARAAITARASSTPSSIVRAMRPWSSNASIVLSGKVFTVSGPIRLSTYSVSG